MAEDRKMEEPTDRERWGIKEIQPIIKFFDGENIL